ncbi:LxmA leader domain family RiPP [Nocardioides litoris]|uniref:LxmA leader domain family RiPP n=1 Tax=Nocardioides litoris TaxID=1926648 RepID=UPI0014771137|nr:LxmA leader domain family RiPP [Nocardioides litoris]
MSKDELVGGFKEYSDAEEINNQVEEGDETPATTVPCSAIGSAILTNNFNC